MEWYRLGESERIGVNQKATVGGGDREANQKEELSGKSWGLELVRGQELGVVLD